MENWIYEMNDLIACDVRKLEIDSLFETVKLRRLNERAQRIFYLCVFVFTIPPLSLFS